MTQKRNIVKINKDEEAIKEMNLQTKALKKIINNIKIKESNKKQNKKA